MVLHIDTLEGGSLNESHVKGGVSPTVLSRPRRAGRFRNLRTRHRFLREELGQIPVRLKGSASPVGRGRACSGHPDYLALCINIRGRRDKPGDDAGMRFNAIKIRSK
jgi:hypothetical protein